MARVLLALCCTRARIDLEIPRQRERRPARRLAPLSLSELRPAAWRTASSVRHSDLRAGSMWESSSPFPAACAGTPSSRASSDARARLARL